MTATEPDHADGDTPAYRVSASYLRREQVLIDLPTHSMVSDHSPASGGDGTGPSPGELLAASLAACTAVFVGRNARRHDIPVESVDVRVRFDVGHEPTDGPLDSIAWLDHIDKRVEVVGDLTAQQRDQVAFFIEHCAIGETLKRGLEITEDVVFATPGETIACPIGGTGRIAGSDDPSCCA